MTCYLEFSTRFGWPRLPDSEKKYFLKRVLTFVQHKGIEFTQVNLIHKNISKTAAKTVGISNKVKNRQKHAAVSVSRIPSKRTYKIIA